MSVILLLPLQESCDIFYCPHHTWKNKKIHRELCVNTAPSEYTRMFGDSAATSPHIASCTFFEQPLHFYYNPMYEMYVSVLRIGVILYSAQILCGEVWLKLSKTYIWLKLSTYRTQQRPLPPQHGISTRKFLY